MDKKPIDLKNHLTDCFQGCAKATGHYCYPSWNGVSFAFAMFWNNPVAVLTMLTSWNPASSRLSPPHRAIAGRKLPLWGTTAWLAPRSCSARTDRRIPR